MFLINYDIFRSIPLAAQHSFDSTDLRLEPNFILAFVPKMFRKLIQLSINQQLIKVRTNSTTSTGVKEKWDLYAGVLIERHPIVSKTLTPLEKQYQTYLSQIEFENSLKSNFEIRNEQELKHAELLKKGKIEVDLDDTASKQTAQDLKDAYTEELNKFQLAPRTTDDDKKKNLQSTNRSLEEVLYLLIEQKLGEKSHLILPQDVWKEGETLRQTAERVVKEKCGESLDVMFLGNAPCGFFKYKYPAAQRKDTVGAKIFFFRSTLRGGNADKKIASKFEWLDKGDLGKKLTGSYLESVQRFLI